MVIGEVGILTNDVVRLGTSNNSCRRNNVDRL